MIQLVVSGTFLDLYEVDPPKLTYSIEDITDTKATSIYSKSFRVPATKTNTEFFKTAFEVNGYDFDVTAKASAQILYDGNLLQSGYLILRKIYLTNFGNAADYEIVFLGETRDFITELNKREDTRTEYIDSLDFSDLAFNLTYTNISQSWNAYNGITQTDINGGLFSGSLVFPLVDFGNTYTGTTPNEAVISRGEARSFTQSAWPLTLNRFRPMIRAKTIFDKIFDEAGYTYESNFITASHPSPFHAVYLSAWGNEPFVSYSLNFDNDVFFAKGKLNTSDPNVVTVYSSSGLVTSNFGFSGSTALKEVYDYNGRYNNSTGLYTTVETGDYSFGFGVDHKVYYNNVVNRNHTLTFRLMKSGSATPLLSTAISQSNDIYTFYGLGNYREGTYLQEPTTVNLNSGDKIYVDVSWSVANVTNVEKINLSLPDSFYKCYLTPSDTISVTPFIRKNYKKIDFVRDILTKFRLTIAPSKTREKHFIIEPWKVADVASGPLEDTSLSYIASGDVLDWTNKLDLSKDTTIEPLFNEQKLRIVFKDKEDRDYWNQYNQDNYGEVFGTLNVDANNPLLSGERTVTTNISPTIVTKIRGWVNNINWGPNLLPQIYQISEGKYEPISPNQRLLFYNGLVEDFGNEVFYIQKEDTTVVSQNSVPQVTPYFGNTYGIYLNQLYYDLNWQRETGYFFASEPNGYSAYDTFWQPYIDSIYDKWSRRVKAYFILDSNDLANWDFDNVIFVKDTYYYVEKIYDVPIGKKESVLVDLIKLSDYTPNTNNFIPPTPPVEVNVWGDWPVIWNTTTDTWED
jgi:hypothetical protein